MTILKLRFNAEINKLQETCCHEMNILLISLTVIEKEVILGLVAWKDQ